MIVNLLGCLTLLCFTSMSFPAVTFFYLLVQLTPTVPGRVNPSNISSEKTVPVWLGISLLLTHHSVPTSIRQYNTVILVYHWTVKFLSVRLCLLSISTWPHKQPLRTSKYYMEICVNNLYKEFQCVRPFMYDSWYWNWTWCWNPQLNIHFSQHQWP